MEHHRNASDLWHLDQCTKRCLANHALERKSPKSVSHKNGTQHTEWWEEFFRWKSLEHTKYCINFDVLCLLRLFLIRANLEPGYVFVYKQIQNCDQFASSKQYVVVMHYLKKKNVCMEKKNPIDSTEETKLDFWIAWKLEQKNFGNKPKRFLNENPIFLHTRFFSDPLLLHFL